MFIWMVLAQYEVECSGYSSVVVGRKIRLEIDWNAKLVQTVGGLDSDIENSMERSFIYYADVAKLYCVRGVPR